MIHQNEVRDIISEEVPSLRFTLNALPNSVYKYVQNFTDYTKWHIRLGNSKVVKRCFETVERFLTEGDAEVKGAFESVYIYSISRLLESNEPEAVALRNMMGDKMKIEYLRQLTCCQA